MYTKMGFENFRKWPNSDSCGLKSIIKTKKVALIVYGYTSHLTLTQFVRRYMKNCDLESCPNDGTKQDFSPRIFHAGWLGYASVARPHWVLGGKPLMYMAPIHNYTHTHTRACVPFIE